MTRLSLRTSSFLALVLVATGCGQILGLDSFVAGKDVGAGGDTGSGGVGGTGQGGGGTSSTGQGGDVTVPLVVTAESAKMGILRAQTLTANKEVTWSVEGGDANGRIDEAGRYISSEKDGDAYVIATATDASKETVKTKITVVPLGIEVIGGKAGAEGNIDGLSSWARFARPQGVLYADFDKRTIVVADTNNHTIRTIVDNNVATIAGIAGMSGHEDGTGSAARFDYPTVIAKSNYYINPTVWIADGSGTCIRSLDNKTGAVETFLGVCGTAGTINDAGGPKFTRITDMAYVETPQSLIVCDGILSQVDVVTKAVVSFPQIACSHIKYDSGTRNLYIVTGGKDVSVVNLVNESILEACGAAVDCVKLIGQSTLASVGLVERANDYIYLASASGDALERCTLGGIPATLQNCEVILQKPGNHQTIDGQLGQSPTPTTYRIQAMMSDGRDLYFTEDTTVRRLNQADMVSILAGSPDNYVSIDGDAKTARVMLPMGIASAGAGKVIFTEMSADSGRVSNRVRELDVATRAIRTITGTAFSSTNRTPMNGGPDVAVFGLPGSTLYVGGRLFVLDMIGNSVREVDPSTGFVSAFVGDLGVSGFEDNVGVAARFKFEGETGSGGAMTTDGSSLYISDTGNFAIRKVDIETKQVSTVAGGTKGSATGPKDVAQFTAPVGIAYYEGRLYVADVALHEIRAINVATGDVETFLGSKKGTTPLNGGAGDAVFVSPYQIVADNIGGLFVGEMLNSSTTIRRIDIAKRTINSFAGTPGKAGLAPSPLPGAVRLPYGFAIDESGDLLFTDAIEGAIAAIRPL